MNESIDVKALSDENIDEALKHPGQPVKYRPEYCKLLIDFMGEGYSYEAFAGHIGVAVATLYNWENMKNDDGTAKYPQYLEAKKRAFAKNRIYWETAGRSLMFMGAKDVSPVVWIFNMKNRFKWRDNVDVTTNGEKVNTLNGLFGQLNHPQSGGDQSTTEEV